MKKQYIFLVMIGIIIYILFLILSFTIKEYIFNKHLARETHSIAIKRMEIKEARETIKYKGSKAYKNLIQKEQFGKKNKGEQVIILTTEPQYNKFTQEVEEEVITPIIQKQSYSEIDNMQISEKWIHFLFSK
ncbi:MAG: hypothetical protein GY828_05210 [Candidatus Gracilibacteria bacterium]|nr:hypothetical protein [Candidatus Gracilibacteria bacterium]